MSQFSTHKIKHYLDLAQSISYKSDFPRHKLGAILVYKNSVLAHGFNSCKTSPVQKKYNAVRDYNTEACYGNTNCIHAEINCLNKVKYLDIDFSKTALFIYREHKNGKKAMARPCPACRQMITDLGIHDIYYTTESGYCYERID